MPYKLYIYDYRHILVLEDNISNITLLKLKSLSSLILINIIIIIIYCLMSDLDPYWAYMDYSLYIYLLFIA